MQRGFTLVELIVIMVLVGILSIYAIPKTQNDFTAGNSVQELMQALRFVQQQSMANTGKANSGIQISSDGFTFINATSITQEWKLLKPTPKYTVTISPTGSIVFNGHGIPTCSGSLACTNTAQAITVSANGNSSTFYLEPYTGYVHR